MPFNAVPRAPAANRLLAALPKKECQRLRPELEQDAMPFAGRAGATTHRGSALPPK